MNRVFYKIVSGKKSTDDFKEVTVYGIALVSDGCETQKISDISSERGFVENIAQKLNSQNVSEVHFRSIVEDFVARQIVI